MFRFRWLVFVLAVVALLTLGWSSSASAQGGSCPSTTEVESSDPQTDAFFDSAHELIGHVRDLRAAITEQDDFSEGWIGEGAVAETVTLILDEAAVLETLQGPVTGGELYDLEAVLEASLAELGGSRSLGEALAFFDGGGVVAGPCGIASTISEVVTFVESGGPRVATTGTDAAQVPDLGSGWVLQLAEDFPGRDWRFGRLAGSLGSGFVVTNPTTNQVHWSADGVSWESAVKGPGAVFDVAGNQHGFIATPVSFGTAVRFSSDGINWERVDVGPELTGAKNRRVVAGPNGFIVVGTPTADCFVEAFVSADGIDWEAADLPGTCHGFLPVAVGDGWTALMDAADEVTVVNSVDGVTWTDSQAQSPPPRVPRAWLLDVGGGGTLAAHDSTLVLAGEMTDDMWVSTDNGDTWTQTSLRTDGAAMTVIDQGFVGVEFKTGSAGVVREGSSTVLFSPDGTAWSEFPVDMTLYDVAAAGDSVIALGTDGVYLWTPPPGSLAVTGVSPALPLLLGGVSILVGLAFLSSARRRHHA